MSWEAHEDAEGKRGECENVGIHPLARLALYVMTWASNQMPHQASVWQVMNREEGSVTCHHVSMLVAECWGGGLDG